MSNIIKELEKEQLRTDLPKLEVGDTVRVFVKVVEGNRRTSSELRRLVIKMRAAVSGETFTGSPRILRRRRRAPLSLSIAPVSAASK